MVYFGIYGFVIEIFIPLLIIFFERPIVNGLKIELKKDQEAWTQLKSELEHAFCGPVTLGPENGFESQNSMMMESWAFIK